MSNRDQNNIDINLQFVLALSKTFNDKESVEQQTMNIVKTFFNKIFKSLEANEPLKRKKMKTLADIITNASRQTSDKVPLEALRKLLQLLFFIFNRKQYTFLDKDNVIVFQEIAVFTIEFSTRVIENLIGDAAVLANTEKRTLVEEVLGLVNNILNLLLVPDEQKFTDIPVKTIMENFDQTPGLDALLELFAKTDRTSNILEFFDLAPSMSDALKRRNNNEVLSIIREKLLVRESEIINLMNTIGKLVLKLSSDATFSKIKNSYLKLIVYAKKSQTLEKAFIKTFESILNETALPEIDSLLSTILSERPCICDNSQNNLRVTLDLTAGIVKRVQDQEKSDGDSLLICILTKLYQNLEFSEEEIQNIDRSFDIKNVFAILVNALSQVELLSQNLSEQEPVEAAKKSESEKMKIESEDIEEVQSSLYTENSQSADIMESFQRAALKDFKSDVQSVLQNVDLKSQASGKPVLANKEAAETSDSKPKLQDVKFLVRIFNSLLVRLLKNSDNTLTLDFMDIFGVIYIHLKALSHFEGTADTKVYNFYKEELDTFVNGSLQQNIKYPSQFYCAFFDTLSLELSSTQSNQNSPTSQLSYWFIVMKIILLYGASFQRTDEVLSEKVEKVCFQVSQKILKCEQSLLSFYFLILVALFMIATPKQKAQITSVFLVKAFEELKNAESNPDLIPRTLVLLYEYTCTRSNEFETYLREILLFNADTSKLKEPLNAVWLLNIINLKKYFFKDIHRPEWFDDDLKDGVVTLAQELNTKINSALQEYTTHSSLLGLIIYCNYLTYTLGREKFTMLPLVRDFESLKKTIPKSIKLAEIIQLDYEVLETFEAYDQFDSYSKIQYLVQLFAKFVNLNVSITSKSQPSIMQPESDNEEVEVQLKLWNDVLELLGQVDRKLSEGISGFLEQVLTRSKKFSNVNSQEGKQKLSEFLMNVYFFSRYTFFNITPKLLGTDEDDIISNLMQCLTDVKDFEQNVEARFEEFYKLFRNKDYSNFFLKLLSFCFLPSQQLKKDTQSSQDASVAAISELVREIVVLSVLKGEILRLFTSLTKKLREEYGKELPDEPLHRTFVACAEYLISNKELPIEDLPQIYQLFSFETQPAYKKLYFKLFVEIKKFSYLLKNLNIHKIFESQRILDQPQFLAISNILRRLFNHVNKGELVTSTSKLGFMMILEMSANNTQSLDKISQDFLSWTNMAVGLSPLKNTQLTEHLLRFTLSHIRSFPTVKQLISRNIELKKNAVIPYLLKKSSLSVLEIFSKLDSELSSGLDISKDSIQEGLESKGKSEKDSLNSVYTKKVTKKLPFNKTGKKKAETTSKKHKEVEEAKKSGEQQKQALVQAQQTISQDLAGYLFGSITDQVFNYFGSSECLKEFEQSLSVRTDNLPYNLNSLKQQFDDIMDIESDLKYDELYAFLSQNEFNFLLDFVDLLYKSKIQDETEKPRLEKRYEVLLTIINIMLRCLLYKIQKVSRSTEQSPLELKNAAGLFMSTLDKLQDVLAKDKEFSLKPHALNEIISDFLIFMCENDIKNGMSNEIQNIMKTLFTEINSFITSLHIPKESKNAEASKPIIETIEEETEPDDAEICSFTITGSNHHHQHFYYCYTCGLVGNKGCCVSCARKCHKGHDVVYGKHIKCYCDCGDGASQIACKCLKKDGRQPKKEKEKERKSHALELKPKYAFNSSTFLSTFGSAGQLDDILRTTDEKKLRQRVYEEEEGSSSPNDLEEEKFIGDSSDEEGASEDQMRFILESNKLKNLSSLLPHSKFSKSPSIRLAPYLSNKLVSRDKDDREMKIESDEQSVSLSNMHEFLDERSLGSVQSTHSPRRSFQFNPLEVEKKMKDSVDQKFFNEKFNSILTGVRNVCRERNYNFDYIEKIVALFNEYCNNYLSEHFHEEQAQPDIEEEKQVEPIQTYDFSRNLQDVKPAQSLDTKLMIPNRTFAASFDLKMRIPSERNQMLALFIQTNPPCKKRMDYDGRNLVAVAEIDSVYLFNKKEFVSSGSSAAARKQSVPSLLKPFGMGGMGGLGEDPSMGLTSIFDKNKAVGRFTCAHPVLSVLFNKASSNTIALVGVENITLLTIEANGSCGESRVLTYHNDADFILKASWVPENKTAILIVTLKGIQIFDTAQSLTEPIIIFSALETYLKDGEVFIEPSKGLRIVATSTDGQIYTQSFTLEGRTIETCDDLIMVETIMVPGELKKMNGTPSISAHLSPLSNLFFMSWEDSTSLVSRLELEREPEVVSGCRLNPAENKEKAALLPHLGRSGTIFSGFEDISVDENSFFAAAVIRKGSKNLDFAISNLGIGVVIKVTKDMIQYQPIINPTNLNIFRVESFISFDFEQKGVKNYYILCIMEDGSIQVNQVNPSNDVAVQDAPIENFSAVSSNILSEIDNMIKPQSLENSGIKQTIVTNELLTGRLKNLAVDFVERATPLNLSIINPEDEVSRVTNPQLQNTLKPGVPAPAQVQLEKSAINFSIKLKSKDYVIYGARLKFDVPSPLKISLYGRDIPVISPGEENKCRFVDVVLTEDEIAYVYLAERFKFSILPVSKKLVLKIHAVEILGTTVDKFLPQLKTNKLKTLKQKLSSISSSTVVEENSADVSGFRVKSPIIIPDLQEDKESALRKLCNTLTMISSTDSAEFVDIDKKVFESLTANITKAIPEVIDLSLKKSMKRTLKAVLKIYKAKNGIENQKFLGYRFDYDTLKDFSNFKNFEKQLQPKSQLTEEGFSNIISVLIKIQYKRPVQLLKMFSEFPNMSSLLCSAAIQAYKDKKSNAGNPKSTNYSNELNFVVELLILNYNYSKNKALQQNFAGQENLKLTDELLDDSDIKKAGESIVNLLIEFITSVPKTYQNSLIKSLLSVLFVESQSFVRERGTDNFTKLEYGSNIYKQSAKAAAKNSKASQPQAPREVVRSMESMDLENENLTEEELMNLAIQMSLSQEEKKMQEEAQNKQRAEEKIDEETPEEPENSLLPQRHSSSFYRFDICKDLFNVLFVNLEEVQSRLSEYGMLFKLIYRVLRIQQNVAYSLQTNIDETYVNSFAGALYNKMTNMNQNSIANDKDVNTQKLLCYLNLANICLMSRDYKGEKSSVAKISAPVKEGTEQPSADIQMGESQELDKMQEIPSSNKVNSTEKDFGAVFIEFFQAREVDSQLVSNWIHKTLEKLFEHFKSGQGTIYCNNNDDVLKKNVNLEKISKTDIEYYTHAWTPVFRSGDITKREGNLFVQLDQDIFGSIVMFTCALLANRFKISDINQWPELLSRLILIPPTSQLVPSFNKMLLKKICGSKEESHRVTDLVCFEMEVEQIKKVYQGTDNLRRPISYDFLVILTNALAKINNITQVRTKNWSEFCLKKDPSIIPILHQLVLMNQNETIELSFKLLTAYYTPQEEKDSNKGKDSIISKEKGRAENVLSEKPDKIKTSSAWSDVTKEYINKYIDEILLDKYSSNITSAALKMLTGLWNIGNNSEKIEIIRKIIDTLPQVAYFGQNAEYLFGLLAHISKHTDWESSPGLISYRDRIVEELIALLHNISSKILSHPNHLLYTSLQEFIKDRANSGMKYYLDGEACFRCYEGMNIPYQDVRLNEIKEDYKYTSHCVLARLNNSYSINAIVANIDERGPYKQLKAIKTINIFVNNKSGIGLIDLKNNWTEWKKLVSHTVDRRKLKEGEKLHQMISLPLPSTAKNIMIEFKTSGDSTLMICPICLNKFDNRLGTGRCPSCSESVLDCRKCGYGVEPDSLFCSHCGASPFMNYEIVLSARIGYTVEKIDSEKARETCEKTLQDSLEDLNKCMRDMRDTRGKIQDLISHYHRSEEIQFDRGIKTFHGIIPSFIQDISHSYQKNARENFEKLMKTVGSIKSMRKVIKDYILTNSTSKDNAVSKAEESRVEHSNRCYSCLQNTLNAYVTFLSIPTSIMGLAQQMITLEPRYIHKLLSLGLNSSGSENTKKVLTAVLSLIMVSIHHNNDVMLNQMISDIEKDINDLIENSPKSIKDVKVVHYKMIMLLSTNRSILKIIPVREKKNASVALPLQLWRRTTERIEQIFTSVLKSSVDNIPLAEFVLNDILRFLKGYITLVGVKTTNESSDLKKSPQNLERIEEEKLPDKDDESIQEEDLDKEDDFKMEIPEDLKEVEDSKDAKSLSLPFEKFGLKLIHQILFGESDKDLDKELTKDKLLTEVKKRYDSHQNNRNNSWIQQCLTHSSNKVVASGQAILKELISPKTLPFIFDIYNRSITEVFAKEYKNEALFKGLREFVSIGFKTGGDVDIKLLQKIINSLFVLVERQLYRLEKSYSSQLKDTSNLLIVSLNTGFEIYEVLDVINTILKNNGTLLPSLKSNEDTLQHVLKAFLLIRKFTNIKNNYILECENLLTEMFESLKPDTEEDKKAYVFKCISALVFYKDDNICQTFLFDQILSIVCPPKQKKEFQVQLIKYQKHEEYIRGQLNRTPYKASDIGITMADIRKRICKELEIHDTNPYELLVANNLVDMDLPIYLVYEKVWVAYCRQKEEENQTFGSEVPPMKVVMRISGLDGEATENRVSNLTDDSEDEKTIELRVKLTEVFQNEIDAQEDGQVKTNGMEILLKKIKELSYVTVQKPLLKKVVKLLTYCAKIQQNRTLIVKLKGLPIMLELLLHLFPHYEPNEQDSIVENLLMVIENVLKESQKDAQESMDIEHKIESESGNDPRTNLQNIEMCLSKISHDSASSSNSKLLSSLTKILPFLTGDQEEPCRRLISSFLPYLKFSTVAKDPKESQDLVREYYINKFIEMIQMLPIYFNMFRTILREEKLMEKIIEFIKEINPDTKSLNLSQLETNQKNLSYSMRIILGLIKGDQALQQELRSSEVLDLIYKLADPKIKLKEVGKYCEEIIEYLLSDDFNIDEETRKYIKDIKQAELLEKKKKAQQAREQALKRMGFDVKKAPQAGDQTSESRGMDIESQNQANTSGLKVEYDLRQDIKTKFATEEIKEEKILACISCHEGYINKPDQILGIYTFTMKLKISNQESWLHGDPVVNSFPGFSTVTHFNCIHLHCHNAAAKADKHIKKPKSEWDGAVIRNSHTGCNGWFPIKGPKITDKDYDSGLLKFHQTLASFVNYEQDFVWLHICDLNHLLTRFAKYETFSKESKGGAAEHNLMFVPFYIQLIANLVRQKPEKITLYHKKIEDFIKDNNKNKRAALTASSEDFMLILTTALLFVDHAFWNESFKPALLHYMLNIASNQVKISRSQETSTHQIKVKISLSPESDAQLNNDQNESGPESMNNEQSRNIADMRNGKSEKFFDEILPLMMGFRLVNEIIEKLHIKCVKAEAPKVLDKNLLPNLEKTITESYEQVLVICEEVNKLYKEEFLQIKYFTEWIQGLNLNQAIIQEHGNLEQFMKTYLEN